jgi:hypothetical protein
VLVVPLFALALVLFRWPSKVTVFAGPAITAFVAWLVVFAFVYRDTRRLKRVNGRSQDRQERAEFLRRLDPTYRKLFRRRRRSLLAMSLVSWIYGIVGVCMVLEDALFGYFVVAFCAFASAPWTRLALRPPRAILEMPTSLFGLLARDDVAPDGRPPRTTERARPARFKSEVAVFDSGV